ncbi:MAG: DIP1984 family protein [Lachnospiraceae bacterium]|nr:DIP1984 family protein [Lachnospiraceae bacterium]
MKLAEALIERADLKMKIKQITERMKTNVVVQEGDEPSENVLELLKIHESMIERLELFVVKINRTNNDTVMDNGLTLAEAIAKRDCFKLGTSTLRAIHEASLGNFLNRYSRSEIKYVKTIDMKNIQKDIELGSKKYREIDIMIQEWNWKTDLI